MSTSITVIGSGYVGLIQAVGLADFGNRVVGVDIRPDIVDRLSAGEPTIFEHGIGEYLSRNLKSERLSFTTDVGAAVSEADVVFIAVGTPENGDGSADVSSLDAVLDEIASHAEGFTVVVVKSTVPVGTNRRVAATLAAAERDGREFTVVSNPEFLREGKAIHDFFHPDRIVLGFEDPDSRKSRRAWELLEDIYRPLYLISTPFVRTDLETAELIKYAANAFLATKITFINQIANLAEAVGADVHGVARAMGMDGRISPKFLHPGPGYGGSCFPKDTKALAAIGRDVGVEMTLVDAVIDANRLQMERTADKAVRLAGGSVDAKPIGLLGLAFKAETDDIRESPALVIADLLIARGAYLRVHDPKALTAFRERMERIGSPAHAVSYHDDEFECLVGTVGAVIVTDWNEYRNLDLHRALNVMGATTSTPPFILDSRNILDPHAVTAAGFRYAGTGRSAPLCS